MDRVTKMEGDKGQNFLGHVRTFTWLAVGGAPRGWGCLGWAAAPGSACVSKVLSSQMQ